MHQHFASDSLHPNTRPQVSTLREVLDTVTYFQTSKAFTSVDLRSISTLYTETFSTDQTKHKHLQHLQCQLTAKQLSLTKTVKQVV